MDPNPEEVVPESDRIHRKKAKVVVPESDRIRRKYVPQEPNLEVSKRGSTWRGKLAGITLLGLTVGAGAVALEETQEGHDAHASTLEQQDRNKINIDQATGTSFSVSKNNPNTSETSNLLQEKSQENPDFFNTIFHDLSPEQEAEAHAWVDDFEERIKAKPGWEKEHVEIPMQYKAMIIQTAKAHGLDENMLLGIISIENGGGTDIENPYSGALGVAQFLPKTARDYGLKVNEFFDERENAGKSIAAAGSYLEDHKALFDGDEGITIWSYHAGQGNVFNAMRVYFIDKYGEDIGDYANAHNYEETQEIMETAHELMERDKLDVFKLLNNEAVKTKVLSELDDYTETYVPQVVALAKLLRERMHQGQNLTVAAQN